MNGRKNARPAVGAAERAKTEKTAFSIIYHTMPGAARQGGALYDVLPIGRENAIPARQLAQMASTTPRHITRQLERLRQAGFPVCAACTPPCGYYKPENVGELLFYRRALARRLRSIQRSAAGLEIAQANLEGQATLWGGVPDGRN